MKTPPLCRQGLGLPGVRQPVGLSAGAAKANSSSQFRRLCRNDFLNYLRVREWQDIYTQLRQVVKELGLPINSTPSDYRSVHTALLTGLLSHIGQKDADKQEFTGARNARFSIFPGSGLFKKPPKWTMVAELVETSRLWGASPRALNRNGLSRWLSTW